MSENSFLKIIVVGQQNVGKTCILARYSRDQFDNTCPPTLGMDFQSKLLEYKGQTFRLQLWDIAGQERYNSVSKLYVRGSYGALVVADVKEESTLQNSLKWKKMIEESCDMREGKPIPILLVQNKVDELKGIGQIQPFQTKEYLQKFAKENGFSGSIQCSAKDNTNIPDIFNLLIDEIQASGLISVASQENDNNYSRPKSEAPRNESNLPPPSNTTQGQTIKLSSQPASSSSSGTQKKKKDGGCC